MAAIVVTLAACGDGGDSSPAAKIAAPGTTDAPVARADTATTTTSATTTSTTPTATTTTTSTTSTTSTTTSTTLPQTRPIAPPVDADASEPVIEMGTISIPKLDVSMTMYEGIRMPTLDRGPGHWPGSALPGQAGNVVVAGHRTTGHAVFRHLDRLVPGDEIVFEDDRGRHVYLVSRVEIVDPTAVWIVDPTETPTATLFACHPPGSTRQRIVVFADPVTS